MPITKYNHCLRQLMLICESARQILEWLREESLESFVHSSNEQLRGAVAWHFQKMAEMAFWITRKYPEINADFPSLRLRTLCGVKAHLANTYDLPDWPLFWAAARYDLPDLMRDYRAELSQSPYFEILKNSGLKNKSSELN